ncbi:aminopeptidase N [Microplitis mediator]|uniref:aminopeptidase N n=1 Tax=Microplitis mediator TaxID=375433 RepID=UPI0025564BBD|nr:aminopeptidase N [Microplitis mediator]XP_057331889.1 aminopeptidase N [Microplitis mediator]
MTQSCEVLAMMDAHTTTFGRKRGCTISRCGAFLLTTFFILGIVATGLLVYHFAPCLNGKSVDNADNFADSALLNSARTFATADAHKKKIDVRLPKSVIPDSYEIKLMPFIWEGNFTFNGEVTIYVNVTKDTKNITLHAADMKIDYQRTTIKEYNNNSSTKNVGKWFKIFDQTNDTARQFHIIHTSETLKAGTQYVVYLKFIGYLNDYLQGFYRSSYTAGNQTRWIATTQFQATDARRAFPCFDEPALKAKFQISIARPTNMTSVSNMPRIGQPEPVRGMPSYVWDHYQRSVPMSTYLVAFLVSDFEVLKSADNLFGVWARREAIEQARYSLDIGPKILKHYEDYFQIKFPLPKMDMVALPDFAAGAMENWGLITYRETAMLFQEGVSTSNSQQRVATVIAHELAHQWFGNLVTPSWWSDLWLNEGFASYVEYIGVDSVEPDWKILEQFVTYEVQNVFNLDALASSHPISIEVGHPDEISEIFDRISYGKGASIIRMMDHFLTTKVFKQGLTNYLTAKAYGNSEQNDLWNALTNQAHKDHVLSTSVTVKQIMDTWTLQTGFPVVTVIRDYKSGSAYLTQERFMLQNSTTEVSMGESLWWIPITYTTEAVKNFNNTKPSHWMNAQRSLSLSNIGASNNQWAIFNILETGFYRVNYDKVNWQLIIKQLNTANYKDISTINRGQLIDDALNLARAGRIDYSTALDVTSYLAHETEYVPWKSALTALNYLDNMLNKYQGYDRFRVYMLKLLDNVYREVGFKDTPGDPQLTVFTRIDILLWACTFGHDDCVRNAVMQFQNWRNSPDPDTSNPISPNLKSVVYCTAIRTGGQAEWDFAWERYQKTNVGSEKDLLMYALGCSREPWILSRYLEWATTENSGIRKQDTSRVFSAVANNAIGQPLVFSFLRNQWARLRKFCGSSLLAINNIVKSATKKINTKYELKDLLDFAQEHSSELGSATRTVQQSVEQADANIRWLDRNYITIRDWLLRNTA